MLRGDAASREEGRKEVESEQNVGGGGKGGDVVAR